MSSHMDREKSQFKTKIREGNMELWTEKEMARARTRNAWKCQEMIRNDKKTWNLFRRLT